MGNVTETSPAKAQAELQPLLVQGEQVVKAFSLFRDLVVMTNLRIITVDKQGVTGKKRAVNTLPYKSIRRFSKTTSGGFLDWDKDSELWIWIAGEAQPIKWEFSKGIDMNEIYMVLSHYTLVDV